MSAETPLRFVPLGRCVLCEAARTVEAFIGEDRLFGVPGRFAYRTCTACGTVFQDPQVARDDIARSLPAGVLHPRRPAARRVAGPRTLAGRRDRWRGALRDATRGGSSASRAWRRAAERCASASSSG